MTVGPFFSGLDRGFQDGPTSIPFGNSLSLQTRRHTGILDKDGEKPEVDVVVRGTLVPVV